MSKQYKVIYSKPKISYLNYQPRLHWCGQLEGTTHVCSMNLEITDVYEYSHSIGKVKS